MRDVDDLKTDCIRITVISKCLGDEKTKSYYYFLYDGLQEDYKNAVISVLIMFPMKDYIIKTKYNHY